MQKGEAIVRFDNVSFEYNGKKPILDEVNFLIRRGAKLTLMGQNGAGKSTIFGLIGGLYTPESGIVNIVKGVSIATAKQVIPRDELDLTVREFFQTFFSKKIYDIDVKIDEVLEIVHLVGHEKIHDRTMRSFSGGQQARLLLASALIQDPDILLLDEPTNNLDKAGIAHLTDFLIKYKKTVMVISHDAEFLNAFTEGVLYLDIHTRKVENYVGNYFDVVKQITARVEKENMKNAQLAKEIQANKDKANQFAYKGGQMRLVAKKMRQKAEDLEEEMVDVRKEDKTIRAFTFPVQANIAGNIIEIKSFTTMSADKTGKIKPVMRKANMVLRKNQHLLLKGPNGIGKSTLLEKLAKSGTESAGDKSKTSDAGGASDASGAIIQKGINVGYYRQDFSTLDFNDTVLESLFKSVEMSGVKVDEERVRAVASGFLINGQIINTKIGLLSEGQKGLVAFAGLVLQRPGLLILDEPTNHINFRHLPIIASALDQYQGAMILVSHVPEFVSQIRIDEILDLGK